MSNLTLNPNAIGIEFLSSSVLADLLLLDYTARNTTLLRLEEDEGRIDFIGTGFTYVMNGDRIVGMPSGTVSRIEVSIEGTRLIVWSDLNVSANQFFNFVTTSNWTALDTLLLGKADTITLSNGEDEVRGFGGNDVIRGLGSDDLLIGDAGKDTLWGDAGRDTLKGGSGADRLDGGTGNDTLSGGTGKDRLSGGDGADVFLFDSAPNSRTNVDTITDFNAAWDTIALDRSAFAGLSRTGVLSANAFVAGSRATDAGDRVIYHKSSGQLWFDADGNGRGAKVLLADLADGTALTAADILIL